MLLILYFLRILYYLGGCINRAVRDILFGDVHVFPAMSGAND